MFVSHRCSVHYWTEPNWYNLVFDELTHGQAIIHYSRYRLTAPMTYVYVTTLTYASTNEHKTRPACSSVSLSETNPC